MRFLLWFHYYLGLKTVTEGSNLQLRRNGKYGLIEVKLGQNRVDEGATNILRLAEKIASSHQKIPDFLMVLTGTGFAHRREDGVYVVPIGCLKP